MKKYIILVIGESTLFGRYFVEDAKGNITKPLAKGKGKENAFPVTVGDILPESFFTEGETDTLLENGNIKEEVSEESTIDKKDIKTNHTEMAKYIVIAGEVPALHKMKVIKTKEGLAKAKRVTLENEKLGWEDDARFVSQGDILPESFFTEGSVIASLVKEKFIEEYKPVKLTAEHLKEHPHLAEHHGLKAGDEVHSAPNHGNYKFFPRNVTKK